MNWAWWVILAIGVAELGVAVLLTYVWRACAAYEERLRLGTKDPDCYACLTGASVTSFAEPYRFCRRHKAHWVLIHDLEARERKDALRDRGSGRT